MLVVLKVYQSSIRHEPAVVLKFANIVPALDITFVCDYVKSLISTDAKINIFNILFCLF